VKFGVVISATDDVQPPSEVARMAEERGFESLFFPEHTHIPASRETPFAPGGELPREYSRTYSPFVALMAAAAATDRLLVGTGICLVTERDPIITAKEVATIDRLSAGRFLFGVGAGWNVEEMRNHGTDAAQRFGIMRERIEAMKELWSEDEASYSGRHVGFERIWCWPKPLQQPHPPVLVGGTGPRVLDRVLAFGDEWIPTNMRDEEVMISSFEELARRAAEAGRDPVPITVVGMMTDPARIERFANAGVHRAVFGLPATNPDEVEQALDRYAAVAEQYRHRGA
jgi:probable F420-dependent oxidoreductase